MVFSVIRCLALFLACLFLGCTPTDGLDGRPHGPIDLGSGTIDTSAEQASFTAPDSADSDRYLIVQLDGPATPDELAALAAGVDRIYGYLPHNSFLVKVGAGQTIASLGAWAGEYRPAHKIARALRETADGSASVADGDDAQTIMVHAYPDADLDRIAGELTAFPEAELVGMRAGGRFSRLRLRAPSDRTQAIADALAEIPEVMWIDVEGQRELLNDTTIWVGQSGVTAAQATPIFNAGIHGEGQVIGMIDSGVDVDSCFFRDTERGLPPQNACDGGVVVDPNQRKVIAVDFLHTAECAGGIAATEWDTRGHGTHVAGTLTGDNFARPIVHDPADGMAPGAKLVVQDGGFANDACGSLPGIGCPMVDLKPFFEQAYAQGARVHTNSWGDRQNAIPHNVYTAASEDVDEFMWTHPDFLLFFSAGNSGSNPGTVFSPSTAKNAVSVGATLRANSAESMAAFSGCGPTADSRVKPDITIPGSGIISARGDNNVTTNTCLSIAMTGTSMATPAAAGLATLIRQYYTDGFYPSGAAVPDDGFTPSAALVKATLLNSARGMLAPAAGTIPASCQGWGRILLDDALFLPGQARRVTVADDSGFPQGGAGEERTYTFIVRENESLKATLVWTDFPSTPAAAINLVNDLDLEVSGPTGTFLGNVFSGGVSQPGGNPDRRNTVEQVLLPTPGAGVYTVTVRAFNVPVGPQPFALVLTGDAVPNQPPVADAGPDQTGQIGTAVVLDGSASTDPDDVPAPLSFSWTQTDGPPVTLEGANTAQARFTPTALGTYAFSLVVSDGADESEDSVLVTVVNQPPVADAGPDQTGRIGVAVLLDGSASDDPDDAPSPLSFTWTQTDGPPVTLEGADSAQARFTPAALGTYAFRLVVSDGEAEAEDSVVVTIVNQPPVANAGPDQTGQIGGLVQLDGSASTDPDGVPAPLSFAWTQTDGPPVTLAGADTARPSFTPTALGTATFRLVVSDGEAESEDSVSVTVVNQPPVADAGPDQTGLIGFPVLLDGSGSNDPDDVPEPLSFAWTQIEGPPVQLSGADTAQASFIPSALGSYAFRLVVSDGAASADDTVAVVVVNQAPIADAGPDQTGRIGDQVVLDGTGSLDPDGAPAPLSFAWTQTDGPPVTLEGADTAQARFTPAALGAYTFRLVVSDGEAEADDSVVVTIVNQPPVADAGPDQAGQIGTLVQLDGSASTDPDEAPAPLSFAWTQTDGPPVTLTGADTARPSFTPTALGTATFRLVVSDGEAEADDSVSVTVVNQPPVANAGPDQSGLIGRPVLLDGSGSVDPDGAPSPLSFAWTQIEGPPVQLSGADTAQASFIPSALGTHAFRLVVSDGAASADDTVAVVVVNQTPIADAGPDQIALAGVTVVLDGSGSNDPDGAPAPLSFAWTQTDGPPVTLADADTAQARFTPVAGGTYTFRLLVSDGAGEAEDTVSVAVTVANQGPVADAGEDQTGLSGDLILLDGTGSRDPDGGPAPLSFEWTQIEGPPVTLAGADAPVASFTPTALGTYTFRLAVSDGQLADEDDVTVIILNQGPTADAGPDRTGQVGTQVVLDGSGSSDPDGQPSPLSFAWTQTAGPTVTLTGANAAQASFTPGQGGTYTFRLSISDGEDDDDDDVTVTVQQGNTVVFADDFEQARGWTVNPLGKDTATTGRWERAVPQATANGSLPMQLGTPTSGSFDLATGAAAGASVGANDIDNGVTSIRSPEITLPIKQVTLSFNYYLAHLTNATSADFLRVRVTGQQTTLTAFQQLGAATNRGAAWQAVSVDISQLAGQKVRILIEAGDATTASLVEAAIDDVKIEAF